MISQILAMIVLGMPAQGPGLPNPQQDEIKELFHSIEKTLEEIDKLLLDASNENSGSSTAENMQKASKKMEELLKKTAEGQQKVSKEIDEILKKLPPGGGSGNSSGNPLPDKNKPQKDPQNQGERERDKTPEDPGQPQPNQQTQEPKSPEDSQARSKNQKTPPPKNPPPDVNRQENQAGKWGDLPPLYQELFRNQKTDEIPVRYRKQIEDLYKKLNQSNP